MESNKIDIESNKAKLFLKYRVNMDQTSLEILHILTQEQKEFFELQNKKLEDATAKIYRSTRSLEVSQKEPRWQAFYFGLGKWGLALIIAVIAYSSFEYYDRYNERRKESIPLMSAWYQNYYLNTVGKSKKEVIEYLRANPIPQ